MALIILNIFTYVVKLPLSNQHVTPWKVAASAYSSPASENPCGHTLLDSNPEPCCHWYYLPLHGCHHPAWALFRLLHRDTYVTQPHLMNFGRNYARRKDESNQGKEENKGVKKKEVWSTVLTDLKIKNMLPEKKVYSSPSSVWDCLFPHTCAKIWY